VKLSSWYTSVTPLQIEKVFAVGGPQAPVAEFDGLRQKEPDSLPATAPVRARVERSTVSELLEVLVTWIVCGDEAPGFCETLIWFGLTSTSPWGVPLVPAIEVASCTAARTLSSPAPCCSAGAWMSVAVLMRICFTRAGVGSAPL
jgi:hypothetical protein